MCSDPHAHRRVNQAAKKRLDKSRGRCWEYRARKGGSGSFRGMFQHDAGGEKSAMALVLTKKTKTIFIGTTITSTAR
jgi:hypothetical protein